MTQNGDAAVALKAKADAAFRAGDNLLACSLYAEALEASDQCSPRDRAVLLANRSAASLRCGDVSSATQDALSALLCDQNYVKSYFRLGMSLVDAKWYALAVRSFEAGLSHAPGQGDLLKGCQTVRPGAQCWQQIWPLVAALTSDALPRPLRPASASTRRSQHLSRRWCWTA